MTLDTANCKTGKRTDERGDGEVFACDDDLRPEEIERRNGIDRVVGRPLRQRLPTDGQKSEHQIEGRGGDTDESGLHGLRDGQCDGNVRSLDPRQVGCGRHAR